MSPTRRRTSSREDMATPTTTVSLRNPECDQRPANLSLAGILEEPITQSPLGEWLQSSNEGVHARLARFSSIFDNPSGNPAYSLSRSLRSTASFSSMAPACVHQSAASTQAPSLSNFSDVTPTETSISTGQVSYLSGVPLLEDDNGVLVRPHQTTRTPFYECAFWFLKCGYVSADVDEWHTHCLSHFRGEEPPMSVICPLCEWEYHNDDGFTSWEARMGHIALEHFQRGQTWKTSRPDFGLFQYLWNKRLIDDQDLKELKGGNHNLTRMPNNFTTTGTLRRDREGFRPRAQHVGVRRQLAPR